MARSLLQRAMMFQKTKWYLRPQFEHLGAGKEAEQPTTSPVCSGDKEHRKR